VLRCVAGILRYQQSGRSRFRYHRQEQAHQKKERSRARLPRFQQSIMSSQPWVQMTLKSIPMKGNCTGRLDARCEGKLSENPEHRRAEQFRPPSAQDALKHLQLIFALNRIGLARSCSCHSSFAKVRFH